MANVSNTWKYVIQSHGKYGECQQYLEVYYIVPWEIWRMLAIPGSIYIVPWEIWRILAIPGSILYSPMGNMANVSNTWKYIIQSHGKYGECQQYLEVYYIVPWEIWRMLAIPGSILYSPMGNMANVSNTWKYIIQYHGKYGECQQYLEVYYIVPWEIWRMLAIPGSILYSPMGNMANVSNTWKYIIQSHGKYGEYQQYLEVYYIVPWEIWRMLAIPGSILYSPMGNMANVSNTWKYIIQSHGKYGECQQYLEVYYIVPWEIWRMLAIPGSILYSPMGNMANVSNTWKYIIQSHGKYGECQQYLEVYYIVPWEIWRMLAIPGNILYSPMGNLANVSNTWKYIIQSHGKYGECQQYLEVYYIVPWEIWRMLAIPGSILYSPMGNMANVSNTWKYIIQSHGKYGECQQYLEVYIYSPMGNIANISNTWKYIIQSHGNYGECQQYLEVCYIVPWEIWRMLAIPGSILYSPMGNMANVSNTWKYIYSPMGNMANISNTWKYIIQSHGKYGECQQYLEVYYIVPWEIWRMLAIPGSILYSPMGNMANDSNTWKYIIQPHGKYGECQQYLEVYYIVPWKLWRMLAIPGSMLYSPMGNMANVSNTWKYIIQSHGKYGECQQYLEVYIQSHGKYGEYQQYLEVYYIVPWEIWRMLAIPGSILYSPMGNMANVSNTWKYIIQSHGKYGE